MSQDSWTSASSARKSKLFLILVLEGDTCSFYSVSAAVSYKESLSEYGSGWEWEENNDFWNTYAHVFDQTNAIGIPYRLSDHGASFDINKDFCANAIEETDGQLLYSGNAYLRQISCWPNTGNAGNYYSWPAATAGGSKSSGNEPNSICPKGWLLSTNYELYTNSFYYLIKTVYGIPEKANYDSILVLPFSFLRTGRFYGTDEAIKETRGQGGWYWTSMADKQNSARGLYFKKGDALYLQGQYEYLKHGGLSLRCDGLRPFRSLYSPTKQKQAFVCRHRIAASQTILSKSLKKCYNYLYGKI